jgi:hypothetical protein
VMYNTLNSTFLMESADGRGGGKGRGKGNGVRGRGEGREFSCRRLRRLADGFSGWKVRELVDGDMGVWQGVAMDSLKYHWGQPCPTLLRPASRPSLRRPYGRFRGGPPSGPAAYGRPLPLWTPHTVRLWMGI